MRFLRVLACLVLVMALAPVARAGVRSGSVYRLPGGLTVKVIVRNTIHGESNPRAKIKDAMGNVVATAPEVTGTPTLGGCPNECEESEELDPDPPAEGDDGFPDLKIKNGKLKYENANGDWINAQAIKTPTCDNDPAPHPTPTPQGQGGDDEEDGPPTPGEDSIGSLPFTREAARESTKKDAALK